MFSPALGRVARSTGSIAAPSSVCCALGRPFAAIAQQQSLSRPTHQRRLSSSKASIPPNGSNGPRSSSAQQQPAAAATNKAPSRKATDRQGRKKAAASPQIVNVPHVPPTDHLKMADVKISSFFALHRPISTISAVPPVSTATSFDSIFQPRLFPEWKQVMDNIQTLEGGIDSLDAVLRARERKDTPVMVISEAGIHHDGSPQKSADQILSEFIPFKPPPAPVPSGQAVEAETPLVQPFKVGSVAPTKQRAWSTEVVVTESTDASGKRTYSAKTAPMVEIDFPAAENKQEVEEVGIRQPFLERMRQRQNTFNRYRTTQGRPDMLAISVKRQRKLKMKKHKYKKLMKRTRLLRRKLDRA